jgi:hypothetical protein
MHYYIDSEGKRQSNHLMKYCQTFLNLQGAFGAKQAEAKTLGFKGAPGTLALNAPPTPPLPANGAAPTQVQQVTNNNSNDGYTPSKGAVNMIQLVPPSNKVQKKITR